MEDNFLDQFDGIEEFEVYIRSMYSNDYEKIYFGTFGHNQPDLLGESMSNEHLEKLCNEICTDGLSMNLEHDLRIPPLGKIISAKLFNKKNDPNYIILFGAIVYFKEKDYLPFPKLEIFELENKVEIQNYFNGKPQVGFSPNEIDPKIVFDALAESPNFVYKKPYREERRSADPIIILGVLIPAAYFYPAVSKYLEKQGESIAQQQQMFATWLSSKISKKINRKILYQFSSPYKNCNVSFIVETKDSDLLIKAFSEITNASDRVIKVIDQIEHKNPVEIVYVYDHEKSNRWIPSYIKTRDNKIFTDKPYLMALEEIHKFTGLSLGTTEFN